MKEKSISKYILFIDSSADETRIALFQDGEVITIKKWIGKSDLSETLLIEIEKLLKNSKVKIKDTGQVAVNQGPGSYTGLRIGMTVANFIAWSLGIPIVTANFQDNKLIMGRECKTNNFILPKYFYPAKITKAKRK